MGTRLLRDDEPLPSADGDAGRQIGQGHAATEGVYTQRFSDVHRRCGHVFLRPLQGDHGAERDLSQRTDVVHSAEASAGEDGRSFRELALERLPGDHG